MRISLLALGLLFSATLVAQQQSYFDAETRKTQAWLFDEPSAEYKLTAQGRGVDFCNHSSQKITGFRLGCVERKDGELSILKEGDFEEWNLEAKASETVSCAGWAAFHGFPLRTGCEKGQFAVVEVKLEDGTVWNLKP
ncbi:MAG TPA: hypothetical protein VGW12_04905 [Pyrinomonadaceae bacterium]|nr:hypothetical protein [Pyrinomonadaceae bacterium]